MTRSIHAAQWQSPSAEEAAGRAIAAIDRGANVVADLLFAVALHRESRYAFALADCGESEGVVWS